jgi:RHS repeat-associated protein
VTVLTPSWGSRASTLYAWVYLHQGGRYETVSALYHFRMRDLSPALGRWAQRDPLEFVAGDSNPYSYVGNSSVSSVDPTGLVQYKSADGTFTATASNWVKAPGRMAISYTGPRAKDFKVYQLMQIEVYADYSYVDKNGKDQGCRTRNLPARINLELPLPPGKKEEHSHSHRSELKSDPNLQPDYRNSKDGFMRGRPDPEDPNKVTYSDTPTYGAGLLHPALGAIAVPWVRDQLGDTWITGNMRCTLNTVRVVQRFITTVFLGNTPRWVVHWTSTSEAFPGREPSPLLVEIISTSPYVEGRTAKDIIFNG